MLFGLYKLYKNEQDPRERTGLKHQMSGYLDQEKIAYKYKNKKEKIEI